MPAHLCSPVAPQPPSPQSPVTSLRPLPSAPQIFILDALSLTSYALALVPCAMYAGQLLASFVAAPLGHQFGQTVAYVLGLGFVGAGCAVVYHCADMEVKWP